MFTSASEFYDYHLKESDDQIGSVKDLLFDDREWAIRYVVVDTGQWLPGRKVVISPESIGEPDKNNQLLPVKMTREELEQGPSLAAHEPISRQVEEKYARLYGWPSYWAVPTIPSGMGLWGVMGLAPAGIAIDEDAQRSQTPPPPRNEPVLRSAGEVKGYDIKARDEKIGHVDDFILETAKWVIRFLVVDTRNWLPGKRVLISPAWIQTIMWENREVTVDLTSEQIRSAPAWDEQPITREYEASLYEHYDKPKYWET